MSCECLPAGYQLIKNENLDLEHPAYLFGFVVAKLEKIEQRHNDLIIQNYSRSWQYKTRTFENIPAMIGFLELLFGKYPHKNLNNIWLKEVIGSGMENIGLNIIDGKLLLESNFSKTEIVQSEILLVHEIAHQYIGNTIWLETWEDLWIKEGIATLVELFWTQYQYGQKEFNKLLFQKQQYLSGAKTKREPFDYNNLEYKDYFDSNTYEGSGLWILKRVKDFDGFTKLCNHLTINYSSKRIGTKEFMDLFVKGF